MPTDIIIMLEMEILKGEFDENRRVLHLTAERLAHVRNAIQLEKVCNDTCRLLEQHADMGRCYMLVDMSRIVIEPELVKEYSKRIKKIAEKHLVPNGFLRYGYQITRVTARLAHEQQNLDEPLLFRSKAEALEYIDNLQKRTERCKV